jgi:DNA-binding transcriptional MerR regulator
MVEQRLTIGEVAQRVGRSVRTMHRLEAAGKIPAPARDINGYRAYTEAEVQAIITILNTFTPAEKAS